MSKMTSKKKETFKDDFAECSVATAEMFLQMHSKGELTDEDIVTMFTALSAQLACMYRAFMDKMKEFE